MGIYIYIIFNFLYIFSLFYNIYIIFSFLYYFSLFDLIIYIYLFLHFLFSFIIHINIYHTCKLMRDEKGDNGGVGGAGDFIYFCHHTTSMLFEASKLLEPQLQSFYCSDHKSK